MQTRNGRPWSLFRSAGDNLVGVGDTESTSKGSCRVSPAPIVRVSNPRSVGSGI